MGRVGELMGVMWQQGEPIGGECDADGQIVAFAWQGQRYPVERVCNRWRVSEEWWRTEPAAWREYLKVVTRAGVLCLIAQDLGSGAWWLIRVYD
ncbi:MAG: hypothetical protein U0641_15290 [Anaerolineae bacterium]